MHNITDVVINCYRILVLDFYLTSLLVDTLQKKNDTLCF